MSTQVSTSPAIGTEPICKVRDVAFPRFQAPDLDVMEAFLLTFGMHVAARADNAL